MHKNVITLALVLLPVVAFASPRSEAPAGETIVLHGAVTLTDGKATVSLPSSFEQDAKADGRAVFVNARSNNTVWASAISNGQFTVHIDQNGAPDAVVSWLVLAQKN